MVFFCRTKKWPIFSLLRNILMTLTTCMVNINCVQNCLVNELLHMKPLVWKMVKTYNEVELYESAEALNTLCPTFSRFAMLTMCSLNIFMNIYVIYIYIYINYCIHL